MKMFHQILGKHTQVSYNDSAELKSHPVFQSVGLTQRNLIPLILILWSLSKFRKLMDLHLLLETIL